MSATQARRTSWRTVARDIITFVGGWVLLFQQALFVEPGQVNETFVLIAAALVGVPIGAEGLARVTGSGGGSSEPSPEEAAPPSSPS